MSPEAYINSTERLDATIPGAFPESSRSQSLISTTHQTLAEALYERRSEYTRAQDVRIKVGSWNVAGLKGVEQDVGAWFVRGKGMEESLVLPGDDEVGIYVLGLQEVVDITSATEALRPYTDPAVANRWKSAVGAAMPAGYRLVAEQQLIGLLLLIYVSPAVHPQIKAVSTTSVGTGLMGYMGNKGAVTARLVLGETTRLVFINSHLAAGADKASLDRRIWDAAQITSRTRFDPITDTMGMTQAQGEGLGDEDFAFWFGDLNFRLEGMPGDDVRRLFTIHTKSLDADDPSSSNEDGDSSESRSSSQNSEDAVPLPPELDPASLQTTISSLLPHDELIQQQKAGKAFNDGWREGPIRFLPSYKYDVGKVGVFDSSEKQRCPSWCDRILYRTRAAKQRHDAKVKEQEDARKRDEQMKAEGLGATTDDELLYDYDPETDGDHDAYDEYEDTTRDPDPETVITKEGFSDEILLEYYTVHMRVISSDHKPLEAGFSLKYDAVVPDLKTAIHQEVARELDRQENEGRPSITIVVDRSTGTSSPHNKNKTDSSFDGVDFGEVQFAKSKRRSLTIANTGRVPATFGFTDRPAGKNHPQGPLPPWLTLQFDREPDADSKTPAGNLNQQFTLEPADVCNIELKLKVDSLSLVHDLNEGTASLDEVLVVRVDEGRDHFLPVRASWQQSVLSRTVDKLVKIPEGGVRKLQGQKPDRSEGVRYSVPREIFRLTEAIEDMTERTLAEWGMRGGENDEEEAPWKHNAAWPFAILDEDPDDEEILAGVYDALDCDEPFDNAFPPGTSPKRKLAVFAKVFLTLLESLQDGIITKSLWEKLEEAIVTREKSRQQFAPDDEKMLVLEILAAAPCHNASFLLIVSMLQNIANQIVEASRPQSQTTRSSIELPSSPKAAVRRKTLSKDFQLAIKQLVNKNHAAVLADVLFRAADSNRLKERERTVRKERMASIVELFLNND
ncbi:DNase I-like protein [Periconia macrospinosa]|uniref:DNase I-like protein n=1 Tax=Periconia macrospinosa TaxID=97972 RepID=A0A2V1EAL6_9PLEO|nr:DNase I-like protein [Periconia macrospinosa]